MVRELAKTEDVTLFAIPHCSPQHLNNIERLYSSIKNVKISIDDPRRYSDVVYVGYEEFFKALECNPSLQNQKFFYDQVGVPFNLLWDNFYFKRDRKREKEVYYDILGLKDGEEYIFLHDDPSRGFVIKRKYLRDIRIVQLNKHQDVSILDTLYLVEKCKELHVMNTGLVPFVDQMKIKHDNLNYHKYIRPLPFEQPILKMKWNIIN
jgi:hypothetical protein